jgi:large subunit ribosomal protein L32e
MLEITRLLQLRAKANKKRPKFIRFECWRYKKLKSNWRRPRGLDSKIRKKMKGALDHPNVGYRNPRKIRGLHASGFEEVLVHSIKELEKVNPKKQVVKIGHDVGRRKRVILQDRADELNILILNRTRILLPGEELLLEEGRGFERAAESKEEEKTLKKSKSSSTEEESNEVESKEDNK